MRKNSRSVLNGSLESWIGRKEISNGANQRKNKIPKPGYEGSDVPIEGPKKSDPQTDQNQANNDGCDGPQHENP